MSKYDLPVMIDWKYGSALLLQSNMNQIGFLLPGIYHPVFAINDKQYCIYNNPAEEINPNNAWDGFFITLERLRVDLQELDVDADLAVMLVMAAESRITKVKEVLANVNG